MTGMGIYRGGAGAGMATVLREGWNPMGPLVRRQLSRFGEHMARRWATAGPRTRSIWRTTERSHTTFCLPALFAALCIACVPHAHAVDIGLDIGHSLRKSGSRSASGVGEFEWNRRLAAAVASLLLGRGRTVRVINADGEIDSLLERTRQAEGARLFVSIHHDSVQPQFIPVTAPSRFNGFSVWVSRKNAEYGRTTRCAAAVADQLLRDGFRPSQYHAEKIPGESRTPVDLSRGIFLHDDLVVLKTAPSPAILIEAGVIANPEEETQLRHPVHLQRLAQSIATGLEVCLSAAGKLSPQID
jgi:N-acetylmuramoyl-L-alanine amidase